MLVYIITLIVSSFFAFCSDLTDCVKSRTICTKYHKTDLSLLLFVFSAIPLILVRGFRYGIGFDYFYNYVPSFQNVVNGGKSHYEFLFNVYLKVISIFTSDYKVFFFIDSIFFICLVWVAIYLLNCKVFIPITLFVGGYDFIRSFGYVAQYLAMSICLISFACMIRREFKKSIVLIVLAGFIHISALVYFALPFSYYFIVKIKNMRKIAVLLLFCLVIAFPLNSFLNYFYVNTRFGIYSASNYYNNGATVTSLIFINTAVLLFMFVSVLYKNREDNAVVVALLAQYFAFIFCVIQGGIPLLYRIVWYFSFAQIFSIQLFADYLFDSKGRYIYIKKIFLAVIVLLYIAVTFGFYLQADNEEVVPYVSIFNTMLSTY
ncbi:EpsG family [Bifidobacterium hapali]|uniref:EpsG family n=1 Tax=Bifidobacterium hapali TaxID=1630172 RepID=A0A261G1T7_9BIFI|nr:EpsG family protein [Bifidobacterium hapali]OZG65392.1 EpsG family [Bifidobacterium hapali]